jgi:methylated-DNA-[protein]-cysteine S-methyltransferase
MRSSSNAPPRREAAIDGIVELLAGKPNDLADVVLDLDGVPEFNRGVYDIARTIPPGKTMTYGDIAKNSVASSCARRRPALGRNPVRSWCRATACGGGQQTRGFSANGGW